MKVWPTPENVMSYITSDDEQYLYCHKSRHMTSVSQMCNTHHKKELKLQIRFVLDT
jgi:hypothetical protein